MYCRTGLFGFYFSKDTFDGVAVAEPYVAEMHPEFEQSSVQPRGAIDEEFGIVDGLIA